MVTTSPEYTTVRPAIDVVALAIVKDAAAQAKSLKHATVFTVEHNSAASRNKDIATYICVAMANTPNTIKRISSCDGIHTFEVR